MRTVEAGLHRCCVPLAIVASLAAALWAPPAMAQSVIDLGTLGGSSTQATGINASGQVVGSSTAASGDTHAFLYSNGVMTDLGTLPGLCCPAESAAYGINASGQIVGVSYDMPYGSVPSAEKAFLYSGGTITNLGTLPGFSNSSASGINANAQIVGYSETGNNLHAFLYSGGVMTDLSTLGGSYSQASGINASGQVVGNSETAWGVMDAFLYSNGVMTDLGTLPGFSSSVATGINDSGQIVGYSYISGGAYHAFLCSGGVMTDLGTLGGNQSMASGINASGQIVGYSTTASGDDHAFLYSNGVMTDLNSLLPANSPWGLKEATAINDFGQIVGDGTNPAGPQRAFLLDTQATITSLSPTSATAGGAPFSLTVTGADFVSSTTVMWNGTALATSYISGTELTASVPASMIGKISTASVTVTTAVGTSAGVTFAIHPPRRLGLPGEPERPRRTGQEEGQ